MLSSAVEIMLAALALCNNTTEIHGKMAAVVHHIRALGENRNQESGRRNLPIQYNLDIMKSKEAQNKLVMMEILMHQVVRKVVELTVKVWKYSWLYRNFVIPQFVVSGFELDCRVRMRLGKC